MSFQSTVRHDQSINLWRTVGVELEGFGVKFNDRRVWVFHEVLAGLGEGVGGRGGEHPHQLYTRRGGGGRKEAEEGGGEEEVWGEGRVRCSSEWSFPFLKFIHQLLS